MVAKLQALLDDVHRSHDRVVKHRRRRSGNGSARWVVPWLVDPQTVLREKESKSCMHSLGMQGSELREWHTYMCMYMYNQCCARFTMPTGQRDSKHSMAIS